MIVKDYRTPRGRVVEMPPPVLMFHAVSHLGTLPEGTTWKSLNRTLGSMMPRQRISRPAAERGPKPVVAKDCESCGRVFTAINASVARVCGATCRKRLHRRRLVLQRSSTIGPQTKVKPRKS